MWNADVRVGENLIDIAKIECRGILRIRPEVLHGHGEKCSDGGGEQTSLHPSSLCVWQ